MSLGVIDRYLASRHGNVSVSHPSLTVRGCYTTPPVGPVSTIHTFTWQGQLTINLSYPEAALGEANNEGVMDGEKDQSGLLAWFAEFLEILQGLAA